MQLGDRRFENFNRNSAVPALRRVFDLVRGYDITPSVKAGPATCKSQPIGLTGLEVKTKVILSPCCALLHISEGTELVSGSAAKPENYRVGRQMLNHLPAVTAVQAGVQHDRRGKSITLSGSPPYRGRWKQVSHPPEPDLRRVKAICRSRQESGPSALQGEMIRIDSSLFSSFKQVFGLQALLRSI